jgi:hypothetical protein
MISDELENELRRAFARAAADIAVPEEARSRLLAGSYNPRRVNRRLAAGIAAAAVAAGIAVPLAAGAGSSAVASGSAIRLASYTFGMPSGYETAAVTSKACRPLIVMGLPPVSGRAPLSPGRSLSVSPYEKSAMKTAASSAGGCIALTLGSSYTPTAKTPDPEALTNARPVQVGRYHGSVFTFRTSFRDRRRGPVVLRERIRVLYVQIPVRGGRLRDLVIGGARLSASALINIAVKGLPS